MQAPAAPGADADQRPGWAGPGPDPRWARPALGALLLLTAVGYLWDLGRNGWANSYYAAAVQSGTKSWSAFFFGAFDWGNYITVDKPPVSLWIMALSGRIFGFSSWSMLVPQALLGVAAVALLYAAVRRVWGAPAGLLSAALLALTPAAALMFRFNNPDAALTFLLVAAAYALTRALERGSLRWLVGTAVLLGTAFLTKSLQAMIVVPGFALAYLVVAPGRRLRRGGHLLAAGLALAVSGLWWPLLVDAIPAASRPYVGGSTTNNEMQLILGYNGLGRITGQEGGPRGVPTGGPGGGGGFGGGPGFGGSPGVGRMLNEVFGGFIAWWIPAALIGLVAGVWLVGRARRTDPRWGSLIIWGSWTFLTAGVFSFASGIVHTYYTVALAPGVAALAGMTVPALWRRRAEPGARIWLASIAASTAGMGFVLLGRAAGWLPWLRWVVLVVGLVAAGLLLFAGARRRWVRPVAAASAVGALLAGVAGPLAWSLATIGTAQNGSLPTAGPRQAQAAAFGGPERFGRFRRDRGQGPAGQLPDGVQPPAGVQLPFGGPDGGPGGTQSTDAALVALVRSGAGGYTWAAATPSAMAAAPLQLAADAPVMALGGFSGSDQAISLDAFKALVAARRVHYYLAEGGRDGAAARGGFAGPGRRGGSSSIASWVSTTFTPITVGSTTCYDLTRPVN